MCDLETQQGLLEEEKTRAMETMERIIGSLTSSLKQAEDKVELVEKDLARAGERLKTSIQEVSDLGSSIIALKQHHQTLIMEKDSLERAVSVECSGMKSKVEEIKDRLRSLSTNNADLRTALKTGNQEIVTTKEMMEKVGMERSRLTRCITELGASTANLSSETRTLEKDLEEVREENRLLGLKMEELDRIKDEYSAFNHQLTESEDRS